MTMDSSAPNSPHWNRAVRDDSLSTVTTEYVLGNEIVGRVVHYSKIYQSSLTAYVWPNRPTVKVQSFEDWNNAKRWVERTIADAL